MAAPQYRISLPESLARICSRQDEREYLLLVMPSERACPSRSLGMAVLRNRERILIVTIAIAVYIMSTNITLNIQVCLKDFLDPQPLIRQ